MRLKDQHYAEEKDAQSHKIEKMVLHPAILPDGGEASQVRWLRLWDRIASHVQPTNWNGQIDERVSEHRSILDWL